MTRSLLLYSSLVLMDGFCSRMCSASRVRRKFSPRDVDWRIFTSSLVRLVSHCMRWDFIGPALWRCSFKTLLQNTLWRCSSETLFGDAPWRLSLETLLGDFPWRLYLETLLGDTPWRLFFEALFQCPLPPGLQWNDQEG